MINHWFWRLPNCSLQKASSLTTPTPCDDGPAVLNWTDFSNFWKTADLKQMVKVDFIKPGCENKKMVQLGNKVPETMLHHAKRCKLYASTPTYLPYTSMRHVWNCCLCILSSEFCCMDFRSNLKRPRLTIVDRGKQVLGLKAINFQSTYQWGRYNGR